jgi:hypothetical protein
MVFPGRDPELGVALLAKVALSPLWLLTQKIEKSIEQLFSRDVTIEDRNSLK